VVLCVYMNACRNVYHRCSCICTYIQGKILITGLGKIFLPRADLEWYLPRKCEKNCSSIWSIGTSDVILTAHTWLKIWNRVEKHTHTRRDHTHTYVNLYICTYINIYIYVYPGRNYLTFTKLMKTEPFPVKRHTSDSTNNEVSNQDMCVCEGNGAREKTHLACVYSMCTKNLVSEKGVTFRPR